MYHSAKKMYETVTLRPVPCMMAARKQQMNFRLPGWAEHQAVRSYLIFEACLTLAKSWSRPSAENTGSRTHAEDFSLGHAEDLISMWQTRGIPYP